MKRQDGSVWAWGANDKGQLGNDTLIPEFDAPTLVEIGPEVTPLTIWAGRDSGIVNFLDGSVRTWGGNAFGQLGNGTVADIPVPLQVFAPNSGPFATWIAAGPWATHVLLTDGNQNVWSWGDNSFDAAGAGTSGGLVPTPHALGIPGNGGVAVGYQFSVAVNGPDVTSWGRNDVGQLGQGAPSPGPNPPAPATAYRQVSDMSIAAPAAGYDFVVLNGQNPHTLAPVAIGWGDNQFGQLDNGTTANVSSPVRMNDTLQFQPGAFHVVGGDSPIASVRTGNVWTWGNNRSGQVGNGRSGPGADATTSVIVLSGVNDGTGPACSPPPAAAAGASSTASSSPQAGPASTFVSPRSRRPAALGTASAPWALRAPLPATTTSPAGRPVRPARDPVRPSGRFPGGIDRSRLSQQANPLREIAGAGSSVR